MVIKNSAREVSLRHELRGGKGDIKFADVLPQEMLAGKGRLFSVMTVEPGCSVGAHDHNGEAEIYLVLKGTLQGDDNGTPVVLEPGDVMYTDLTVYARWTDIPPRTGDNTPVALLAALMAMSLCGAALLMRRRKVNN